MKDALDECVSAPDLPRVKAKPVLRNGRGVGVWLAPMVVIAAGFWIWMIVALVN